MRQCWLHKTKQTCSANANYLKCVIGSLNQCVRRILQLLEGAANILTPVPWITTLGFSEVLLSMENHRSAANGELTSGVYHLLMRFITSTFSGAITGLFALAGGFTGALTGALAGKASDTGVLRGAGLGTIAGSVLSVEILEASRAYWCLERSSSWSSSSMADFMEELLHGRFVEEQLPPEILTAHNEQDLTQVINFTEQASLTNLSYDETYNINSEVAVRGLSKNSLRNLPCFAMLDGLKATESICSICLQDIEVGEIARSLPQCHHMFHLACVDKWLTRQGSCPMCRHDV